MTTAPQRLEEEASESTNAEIEQVAVEPFHWLTGTFDDAAVEVNFAAHAFTEAFKLHVTLMVGGSVAAGAYYDDAGPLILAAQYGHIDVVNVFLEKGARVNVHHNDGATPLLSATHHGRLRLLPLLLRRGAHARAGLNLYSQPGWDDNREHANEVCEREWQRRCAIKTFGWDEQEIEESYGRNWRRGLGREKHKARRCWAYLEKIRAAGSFANYERAERERLVRLLDLRLGKRLPDEVLVVIVQCSKTPGDP